MSQNISNFTSLSKKSRQNKRPLLLDIVEEPINKDDYAIIRNSFRCCEFIPSKNILTDFPIFLLP